MWFKNSSKEKLWFQKKSLQRLLPIIEKKKQEMNLKDFQPFLSYEVMLPGESNIFRTIVVTIRDSRAELQIRPKPFVI